MNGLKHIDGKLVIVAVPGIKSEHDPLPANIRRYIDNQRRIRQQEDVRRGAEALICEGQSRTALLSIANMILAAYPEDTEYVEVRRIT